MSQARLNGLIAISLMGLGIILRVIPHPDNFAPITALALFGGAVLPRSYAVAVPLLAIVLSDLIIGLHDLVPVTWGSYALIAFVSSTWLQKRKLNRTPVLVIAGSVFFFLVTNFAVWLAGDLYPLTLAGLQRCFVLALPFFRNTLLSDIVYTAGLFGLYILATTLAGRIYSAESERA